MPIHYKLGKQTTKYYIKYKTVNNESQIFLHMFMERVEGYVTNLMKI